MKKTWEMNKMPVQIRVSTRKQFKTIYDMRVLKSPLRGGCLEKMIIFPL